MELNKSVIINAAYGAWYPKGSKRLEHSLIYHGLSCDKLIWLDGINNPYFNPYCPYTIKAAAFDEAIKMGYTTILWMDCSLWVVEDPNKLINIINEKGGLFIKSGYNLAQTSADSDLRWANETRDNAEKLPELWSCIFGVNLETEQGKNFMKHFFSACDSGVFNTPREHSGLSSDPRFLHARQDQTAASWAYHKSGYDCLLEPGQILSNYNLREENKGTIVLMRGM
jgi:hypothetical protein